ncbi:ECF-type sigma factor [Sorangium sp. So ce321]|uniref:ECF-type sigma factor n=1 Tax=Sorangium sp. So ce321 TaxID=3133300 RepID=UPI003F5FA08A
MADDFSDAPRRGRFPTTHRSAVVAVGSDDPAERARSFEVLVRAYWKPVYKHLRVRWRLSDERAADLTQGFFARALEQRTFSAYDPSRALFRTYMKMCLDRHVMKEAESSGRQKRGGHAVTLSLDFTSAEREIGALAVPAPDSLDTYFDREWTRHLVGMAVDALRERCEQGGKQLTFRVFERYVLDDGPAERPTYAELATELGIKVTDVTNYLAFARREFRRLLLEKLREITGSEAEFEAEARALLGGAR